MRSSLLLVTFGLLGCVSLPHAKLVVVGQGTREVVTGPVVCGPLGFRKVPLQSRWGEYVRVTVSSPSVIAGTVLVHANGIAHEPRNWTTESGALVVDARFPNEDPDARFALERERPIDITLTGLTALNGGTCEGAVFTVEQGALVPSVDERAWIAELERRGGPELAARRERARAEAEARRQAHYAAWEARQQVQVSAAELAQADAIRQAHYAQWEARVSSEEDTVSLSPAGERVGVRGNTESVEVNNVVGSSTVVSAGPTVASSSASGGVAVNDVVGSSTVVSAGATVASSNASGGVVVNNVVGSSTVVSGTSETTIALADPFANPHSVPGSAGYEASLSASSDAEFIAFPTTPPQSTVSAVGEWSQPSDALLRAPAQVSVAQSTAVQPHASTEVHAGWEQPYQPRLDTVAVSTESQVASAQYSTQSQVASAQYSTQSQVAPSAPPPAPCGSCRAPPPPAAASIAVDGAALLNLMLHVGAAAAQAPAPVHAAQPVSR